MNNLQSVIDQMTAWAETHELNARTKPDSETAADRNAAANYRDIIARLQKADEYQGWKNRETWAVNLWLDNSQSSHLDVKRLAQETGSTFQKADRLAVYVENRKHELGGLEGDLVNAALGRVDWAEIIRNHAED